MLQASSLPLSSSTHFVACACVRRDFFSALKYVRKAILVNGDCVSPTRIPYRGSPPVSVGASLRSKRPSSTLTKLGTCVAVFDCKHVYV